MLQHVDNRAEFVELRDGQAALCAGNGRANCTGRAGRFDCRGARVQHLLTNLTPIGAVQIHCRRPGEGGDVVRVQLAGVVAVWLVRDAFTRDGQVGGEARREGDAQVGGGDLPAGDEEDAIARGVDKRFFFGLPRVFLDGGEGHATRAHQSFHAGVRVVQFDEAGHAGRAVIEVDAAIAVESAGGFRGGDEREERRAFISERRPAIRACGIVPNPDVAAGVLHLQNGNFRTGREPGDDVGVVDDGGGANHQLLRAVVEPHLSNGRRGGRIVLCVGDGGKAEDRQQQNDDEGETFGKHGSTCLS